MFAASHAGWGCVAARYNTEAVSALAHLCQLAVLAAGKSLAASGAAGSPAAFYAALGDSYSAAAATPFVATPILAAPFSAADFNDSPHGLGSSPPRRGSREGRNESGTETDEDDELEGDSDEGEDSDTSPDEGRLSRQKGPATPSAAATSGRVLRRHTVFPTSAAAAARQLWTSDLRVVWCLHGETAAVHTTATSTSITSEIVRGNSRFIPPSAKPRSLFRPQQSLRQQQQGDPHAAAPPAPARSGSGLWETEECHLVQRPLLQLLPPALLQQMQQASSNSSRGTGGFVLIDFLSDLQSKFGLSLSDPHATDGAEASGGFSLIRPDGFLAHCGRAGDSKAARGLLDYLIRF